MMNSFAVVVAVVVAAAAAVAADRRGAWPRTSACNCPDPAPVGSVLLASSASRPVHGTYQHHFLIFRLVICQRKRSQ